MFDYEGGLGGWGGHRWFGGGIGQRKGLRVCLPVGTIFFVLFLLLLVRDNAHSRDVKV